MLLEKSGEITPERMKRQSQRENSIQLWMWLVMVRSYKERYCIGTWNVRSMVIVILLINYFLLLLLVNTEAVIVSAI